MTRDNWWRGLCVAAKSLVGCERSTSMSRIRDDT
jgi:hypothetical protein